jgi:arylsulfatase A-like enzyme
MNTKTNWTLAVIILFISLFTATETVLAKEKKSQPNIIYILADDLGYGDLSCYGQKNFSTPNIDKLAAEGMLFTQHYSGSTVCAPSRSVLMTGQHTGHTPIRDNKEYMPEGQHPMSGDAVTIAEVMKKAGYTTGAFGKWGLGFVGTEGDPNKQGFDEFFGYNCQRMSHRYYPTYLWHNNKKVVLPGNDWTNKETFAADVIHEKVLDFMEENNPEKTGKPFFLFYPNIIPHAELIVPEDEILERFKGKFNERPYEGGNVKDKTQAAYGPNLAIPGYCPQENPKAVFAAMVTRLDKQVGEVMAKLEELGIDDNTLVIFTSDNGPHAEGGIHPDDFNSNGILRGMKRDLYEGGIRVPMLARWPSKINKGSESDHPSAFWDVLPTFAEIAGAKSPKHIDGISFLPTLLVNGKQKQHNHLYWEFHAGGGKQAIRKGKWKAVRLNYYDKSKTVVELYNLEEDPSETNNIASSNAVVVSEMLKRMDEEHIDSSNFPFNGIK